MSDANVMLGRAKSAMIAHDYPLAAKIYKSLILEEPDNLDYKMQLGNLYTKAGKDDQALTIFNQVKRADNENLDALIAISGIYRRQERYEESVAVLEQALVICEDDMKSRAKISYNLGFTYRLMKNYNDAINCFEEVVEENPGDVLANNHLGAIYALQGNQIKAIEAYNRGLKYDPNHPILQFNIAKSYAEIGDSQKALSFFEGALRAKPGWTEAIEAYADLLLDVNKVSEADNVVSQALELYPDDVKMHTAKGNVYNRQSVFEDAETEFKKALDVDDEYKNALTGLAHSLENQGKSDEAIETITRAEELNPDDVSIMKQSAHIHISANKLDEAYQRISKLQQIKQNDVHTINLLGQYYIVNDEAEKAEDCFADIKKINPEYNDLYRDWAKRFIQVGNPEKAEPYLHAAIKKNPNDADALIVLGGLYESKNQAGKALQYYKQASKADQFDLRSKSASDRILADDESLSSFDFSASDTNPVDYDSLFSGGKISSSTNPLDDIVSDVEGISLEVNDEQFADDTEEEEKAVSEKDADVNDEKFDFDQFGMDELAEDSKGVNDFVEVADMLDSEEKAKDEESVFDIDSLVDVDTPLDEEDAEEEKVVPLPDGTDITPEKDHTKNEISEESLENLEEQIKKSAALAEQANSAAENAWQAVSHIAGDSSVNQNNEGEEEIQEEPSYETEDETEEEPVVRENEELVEEEKPEDKQPVERKEITLDEEEKKPVIDDLTMKRAVDMLPSIIAAIEDRSVLYKFRAFLDMFKKLREMLDYLPVSQRKEYMTSRNRLLLDYVISKLSGKPGLFATTKALLRSGLIHENPDNKPSEKDGIELVKEVLVNLRSLSESLEDETLCEVLNNEAESLSKSL